MGMIITATPEVLDSYTPVPVKVPENKELYEKLGFVLTPDLKTEDLLEGLGIKPLKDVEIAEWQNFLPTRYLYYKDIGFKRLNIRYKYDIPPIEVLKLIEYCVEAKLFDDLVIRTPESVGLAHRKSELIAMKDPALFGIVDKKVYLLAVWAESKLAPRWIRRIIANINAWYALTYITDGCNYVLTIMTLGIMPLWHLLGLRVFKTRAGDSF